MQQQAMPIGSESISFNIVVPGMTSTRHVAAAAFYHCLGESFRFFRWNHLLTTKSVLATKDLLRVHQTKPYDMIALKVLGN